MCTCELTLEGLVLNGNKRKMRETKNLSNPGRCVLLRSSTGREEGPQSICTTWKLSITVAKFTMERGETKAWQEKLICQLAPSPFLPSLLSTVKRKPVLLHRSRGSLFQIQITALPLPHGLLGILSTSLPCALPFHHQGSQWEAASEGTHLSDHRRHRVV